MNTMERARVLVIDDEKGMLDMLSFSLSHEGFEVETAESGMTALEAIRQRAFDVAVTDLKMPGMDGAETLAALRSVDPELEVIVATGYATIDTAVDCMKRGAFDYIEKPYDIDELARLLHRAVERRRLQSTVALYEASRQLLATLHHDDLLSLVPSIAQRVLRADGASLLAGADPATARLHQGGTSASLRDESARALAIAGGGTAESLRFGPGAAPLPAEVGPADASSAIVYPLRVERTTLGHLVLARRGEAPGFSAADAQRGALFAGQLAVSLENARLYGELAQRFDELVATREQLVEAEKRTLASRLAGVVAHEVNNPLASVQSNLDFLRDCTRQMEAATQRGDAADAAWLKRTLGEIGEVIEEMSEGTRRIAELVASFQLLAQPSAPAAASMFAVDAVVGDCVRKVGGSARFEAAAQPVTAWAAASEVRTALCNLLAFLATETSGTPVAVGCLDAGNHAVVTIEAPGLALGEGVRAHFFDPRLHVDDSCGRTVRLDLKLAVAYHLLVRNGGRLDVAASEGGGTRFLLLLPAAPSA